MPGSIAHTHTACRVPCFALTLQAIESHPSRDPLNELDQKTKKQWSKDVGLHINDTIRQFLDIPVRITIEVRTCVCVRVYCVCVCMWLP